MILAGDTHQLQAVENGGMSLLADALGHSRLAEPARCRAAWEQAASLRLRAGDTTVKLLACWSVSPATRPGGQVGAAPGYAAEPG